jgi:hypothetical protein
VNFSQDLHHMVSSLAQLRSFSHEKCDAILQRRHIEVINAYNPDKSGWERDTVYSGLYWLVGWLLFVVVSLVGSFRSRETSMRWTRIGLAFFLVIGLGIVFVQLQAMSEYVDVCRGLLKLPPATLEPSSQGNTGVGLLIIVAFAGAWFSILALKYREATNLGRRIWIVIMMVVGGGFFVGIGRGLIVELFR